MGNESGVFDATVKKTGAKIKVYRLNKIDDSSTKVPKERMWCDYKDCGTNYTNAQLTVKQ